MSEMSDWFAIPGHIPKSKALKILICEGLLDWLVDEVEFQNARTCRDCMGDGCEWCDDLGFIRSRHIGWKGVLQKVKHGWVKRDDRRVFEDWYVECGEFDEGAEPATILDL